jgi:ABC-2 type transport system permease protein
VIALIGGAMVRFAVSSAIALLGFWLEDVTTLNLVLNGGIWALLGGMIVPVETFPENFRLIANSLPYRYMLSFPIEILRGKLAMAEILSGLGVILFWTLLFSVIIRFTWKKGLKNYSAYGG